ERNGQCYLPLSYEPKLSTSNDSSSHLSILLSNVASIVCCSSYKRCTFSISLPEAAISVLISSIFSSKFVISSSIFSHSFFSCYDNFFFCCFGRGVFFVFLSAFFVGAASRVALFSLYSPSKCHTLRSPSNTTTSPTP